MNQARRLGTFVMSCILVTMIKMICWHHSTEHDGQYISPLSTRVTICKIVRQTTHHRHVSSSTQLRGGKRGHQGHPAEKEGNVLHSVYPSVRMSTAPSKVGARLQSSQPSPPLIFPIARLLPRTTSNVTQQVCTCPLSHLEWRHLVSFPVNAYHARSSTHQSPLAIRVNPRCLSSLSLILPPGATCLQPCLPTAFC